MFAGGKLWLFLLGVFVLHFVSSVSCTSCPFGYILNAAEFSANSTEPTCIRLNCTTSADCSVAFEQSRCSYFTKQCICSYNSVLDLESQQCVTKHYQLNDDEPDSPSSHHRYSSSILQWLPKSAALLFILLCLAIWTQLTLDYLRKKRECKNKQKSVCGNQKQQVSPLKKVNLMVSLRNGYTEKKSILNNLQHSVFTIEALQQNENEKEETEKLIS